MTRIAVLTCMSLALAQAALAQTQQLPPDLAAVPAEIRNLKWQSIDLGAVSTLERCRSLLLLNHTLDELSASATSEADLMSAYIAQKNLGSQFAATPPPPGPAPLGYTDAQKIAVALLRGPMSTSYYATELAESSPTGLASYEQLYQRTCQRRWSEFDEAKHQVRCMSSFLGNGGNLADYQSWATAEAAKREQQYKDRLAATAVQQQTAAAQQKAEALQKQNQQLQQALRAAQMQQQAQAQQAAQAQQQAAAAQQQQQASQVQQPYGSDIGVYGAYAGYAVPSYYGAGTAWYRDAAYSTAARAQTEDRMAAFHGAPAVARPGGVRR